MVQSIADAFKCNQCGATYNLEHALREHLQAAHHVVVNDSDRHQSNEKEFVKAKTKNA